MKSETLSSTGRKTFVQKTESVLEENLSAFAHRFPVSGRIVHAISGEVGGVLGLAGLLERQGLWPEVERWMSTGKPTTLSSEAIHSMFGSELIERTAGHLDIPVESVEIQLALGVPKFFTTLAGEEDDELNLGYGAKKKSKPRSQAGKRADQKRIDIPPP